MIFPEFGAVCGQKGTEFAVFAPYAKEVALKVYETDVSPEPVLASAMKPLGRGCWGAKAAQNLHGFYYTYVIDGVETIDPYAKSAGANGKRGFIFAQGSADPEGWDKDSFEAKPPIVWEVHVRDFSSDEALGLADAGKFSAFKSGVTLGGKPVLIDHLKRLGITYVQLMPVLDFGSVDECAGGYNWGYDPMNFFLLEGSYSSDPHDGLCRVRQLKQLVMNLHQAGIGVVADVVYNHTYVKKGNALDICAPDYYYRMKFGVPCDGSGCGNETRSESAMFSKLMTDSVCYLAKEYHLDGFRFDLMGLHDVDTMNKIRRALNKLYPDGRGKNILMYGEPWYCFPPYGIQGADKRNLQLLDEGIGAFNDIVRDGIRGGNGADANGGYIQGNADALYDILCGVSGGKAGHNALKLKDQRQQIIYAACHDNYTLFDQIARTTPEGADRLAMQHMAGFLIMSAIGIPFLQAGEEFLHTKGGDCNSYKSGDSVNKLDWRRMIKNDASVEYYKGLIEIRKSNPAFNGGCEPDFELIMCEKGGAAYRIGDVVYAVNSSDEDIAFAIRGKAAILADINRAGVMPFATAEGELTVKAHGVLAARII